MPTSNMNQKERLCNRPCSNPPYPKKNLVGSKIATLQQNLPGWPFSTAFCNSPSKAVISLCAKARTVAPERRTPWTVGDAKNLEAMLRGC